MYIAYETKDFLFFWKNHGIPSTFGKEKSFLDYLQDFGNKKGGLTKEETEKIFFSPFKDGNIPLDYKIFQKYINYDIKPIKDIKGSIKHQIEIFGKEKEFGLLNRLDNDTAGFLYFAKDLSIYDKYRQLQAQNKIEKYYIAQVYGNILSLSKEKLFTKKDIKKTKEFIIDYPIMHYGTKKMIVLQKNQDFKKGRGKIHNVKTFIKILHYDKKSKISTLLIKIHKGIRHQIRVHLASIAFPIIGDILYGKSEKNKKLHLWSIGCKILEF